MKKKTNEPIPSGFRPGLLPCACGKVHPVPTAETLAAFKESCGRVAWGKDSAGKDVYTNGITEDALGLTPFIRGWSGDEGYFVADDHDAAVTKEIIASIDWDRVRQVTVEFDVPFNYDDKPGMMFGRELLVSNVVYNDMLRACFKAVPKADLDRLRQLAWDDRKSRLRLYRVKDYETNPKTFRKTKKVLQADIWAVNPKDARWLARSKWYEEGLEPHGDMTTRALPKKS